MNRCEPGWIIDGVQHQLTLQSGTFGLGQKADREDTDYWKYGLCGTVGGQVFADGPA
jgi:hypothetical protein